MVNSSVEPFFLQCRSNQEPFSWSLGGSNARKNEEETYMMFLDFFIQL